MSKDKDPKESKRDFIKRARELDEEIKQGTEEFIAGMTNEEDEKRSAREIDEFLKGQFGITVDELNKHYKQESEDTVAEKAIRDFLAAQRAGNYGKAKKISKRKGFQNAAKSIKRGNRGCLVLAILLTGFGGALYAMYEGVSTIISALN
jgi:hypothetical protein